MNRKWTLSLAMACACAVAGPAIAGDEAGESKAERKLKERTTMPADADFDRNATLSALLDKSGPDAWSNSRAATVEGRVVQVEREEDGDYHLVLAPADHVTDTKRWMIVEVSPAWQKKDKALKGKALKKLMGHDVRVSGWLYYEADAEDPDPRGTRWELHPVTKIERL